MKNYNLVLESKRSEVFKIESLLLELNNSFDLEMERFINFQIAVSEALVNAIVHGNEENPEKHVYVDIECNTKKLQVKIRDEGKGFNITELPDPTNKENILKESGRGIYIIRTLVDEFDCSSGDTGTVMILKVFKK